jgi:hypothetical protein
VAVEVWIGTEEEQRFFAMMAGSQTQVENKVLVPAMAVWLTEN